MRLVKLVALGGALAIATGLLTHTDNANAVPRALPAQVSTRVVAVDVDGDRQTDTVTIEQNGTDTFVVNVVTASGEDDVVQFTTTIDDDWGIEPWYGAAKLDRVRGHELLLLTSGGDGVTFRVLTWRGDALVFEKAPKTLVKGAYAWYLADLDWARFGYRFSTVDGKRYVRDFELFRNGSRWEGTIVKSVWKSGAWTKVSIRQVSLTAAQAAKYDGISGVDVVAGP